jgi:hypothetical protein
MSDCPDYDAVKAMSVALKRPAHSLIALSDSRDPFYITPARLALAGWFAEVWTVLDPPDGVHLRRLHYRYVSLPEADRPPKLDGTPYQNTLNDWKTVTGASADARALCLVDADKFTDRRAGLPIYIADDSGAGEGASIVCHGAELDSPPEESAFAFEYVPEEFEFPDLPGAFITAPRLGEPYAVEVWAEKSTMNDILEPLANRLNLTLVSGVGELSYTHCAWHVQRVLAHRKKSRIIYISDFDPSGDRMPVSVARKIEFLLRRDGHDLDVRLDAVVLTAEQVAHYRLPKIPIKITDKGKRQFEERFGVGAVELDALEALHPGRLARIIRGAGRLLSRADAGSATREQRRQGRRGCSDSRRVRRSHRRARRRDRGDARRLRPNAG